MPDEFDDIDWSLTTWEGSRREQLRRWSELSLDDILDAQEEMADLAGEFNTVDSDSVVREDPPSHGLSRVQQATFSNLMHFGRFFQTATNHDAFDYQRRLAEDPEASLV